MKYIQRLLIILIFSMLGEFCHAVVPLSIPASVYGMILLFAALRLKIVPKDGIKETGSFLVSLLPLMFVVPAVGLLDDWHMIADHAAAFGLLIVISLMMTFAVSGWITQMMIRRKRK